MNRLAFSAAMVVLGLAAGAAAYAVPGRSSVSTVRNGGVFRVSMGYEEFDYVDPALAYRTSTWALLQATCAKLMNYPDKPLPQGLQAVPEVAASYPRISANGRQYTFTLRRGFRFSNGARLTAASFARGIARLLAPSIQQPDAAAPGLQYALDIAGSDAVLAGRASTVSGVVARGQKLVVRLKRPLPDFPARLAMPFFCAVPPGLPADPEGVRSYPSAGPYYVSQFRAGQQVVLRRNRFYRGPRPHHVDRIVVNVTTSPDAIDQLERGAADWGTFAPAAFSAKAAELERKYGLKGRLSLRPAAGLRFVILNCERPLFRDNARLRRAINFAIDRLALVQQLGGATVSRPTDQYLPIGFPGFQQARIYPFRPDVQRARALARGHLRGGKAVFYASPRTVALAQAVKQNLAQIGLDVDIKTPPNVGARLATRGEPFDMAFNFWITDYFDPFAFINLLLDGRQLSQSDNKNWSYFNSPRYNRLMDRASRLTGTGRYRAYASLAHRLARSAAPLAAFAVPNDATLVSARVDPRCKILNPGLDLAAVCLKR